MVSSTTTVPFQDTLHENSERQFDMNRPTTQFRPPATATILPIIVYDARLPHLDPGLDLTASLLIAATAFPFDDQVKLGMRIAILTASGIWAGACVHLLT